MIELSSGLAGSLKYLCSKEVSLARFENHVKKIEKLNFTLVIKDDKLLERCLKSYFFGIRVPETVPDKANPGKLRKTGAFVPPKIGYARNVKSMLFGVLAKEFKVQNKE